MKRLSHFALPILLLIIMVSGAIIAGSVIMVGCARVGADGAVPAKGTIGVEGARLQFVAEGRGTPLLVIGSSVYYPRTFSKELREHFRLIFLDLRHFVTAAPAFDLESVNIDTYTADIEAAREVLGLERVAILGQSMHGALALAYAGRYPERVTRVIVVGSPPVSLPETEAASNEYWELEASGARKSFYEYNWSGVDESDLAGMSPSAAVIKSFVTAGPLYWFDPGYDATPLWEGVHFEIAAWNALMRDFATFDLERIEIRAPLLVVMGRFDFAVPHTLWRGADAKVADLTYRLFERSGHMPQFEEPERFDALLREWFGSP